MNYDLVSPYVRTAIFSKLSAPFLINERILFDFEIILIADGCWKLTLANREYICRKGDVLFIPPDTPHSIADYNNHSVFQPHIHFDVVYDTLSEDVYVSFIPKSRMSEKEQRMIRENVLSELPFPFLKIPDLQYFTGIFYDTIHCFTQKKPFYQLKCKEKMLRVLEYILRENTQPNKTVSSSEKTITSIKAYVDQNYMSVLTLEKLSKQFAYNKFYISALFTKKYGQPLIQYYHSLRISAAKEMLKEGKSITETATVLNMPSIYAFSRFFKNHTGIAPSEYKRQQ